MTMKTLPPGDHALTFHSSLDGSEQPYRLFLPNGFEHGETLPLAIVLHGKGVDHNAWFDLTSVKEVAQRHGYIVAAPNGRGARYYDGPGERDVMDLVALLLERYPIDSGRVYLAGHSMGGWGTWHIALRHPDTFAAICPMSAPRIEDPLDNAAQLFPLIIHDVGDKVVPVEASREVVRELDALGVAYGYLNETGYGHSSRMIEDNLDRMFAWFDAHPRRHMQSLSDD